MHKTLARVCRCTTPRRIEPARFHEIMRPGGTIKLPNIEWNMIWHSQETDPQNFQRAAAVLKKFSNNVEVRND
jgi:hypothetical protein